jgi:hypothetical protein
MKKFPKNAHPNDIDKDRSPQVRACRAEAGGQVCRFG